MYYIRPIVVSILTFVFRVAATSGLGAAGYHLARLYTHLLAALLIHSGFFVTMAAIGLTLVTAMVLLWIMYIIVLILKDALDG